MPTYEYKCEKCGKVFEEFQSIKAEPLKKCREKGCEGDVKRLFSGGAGFIFKGSGFYKTDYRSSDYTKKEKQQGTGDKSAKGSEGKSAKSDAKTEKIS